MAMGTIKVKTPEGEEKEIAVEDLLKERRSGMSPIPKFQANTLWAASLVIITWLAYDKVVQISQNTKDIQQLKIAQAEQTSRSVEQYTQIIRDVGELKVAVVKLTDREGPK